MTNVQLDDEEARTALARAVELEEEEDAARDRTTSASAASPRREAPLYTEDLEAIGAEAGIEAKFVRAAIVEARGGIRGSRASRAVEWLAGPDGGALVRRRKIDRSAARVLESFAAVATRAPFELSVINAETFPTGEGELVLEVPADCSRSHTAMALVGAGVRRVHFSIRSDSESSTELVARGDWNGAALQARVVAAMFGVLGACGGCLIARFLAHGAGHGGGALGILLTLLVGVAAVATFALVGIAVARACTRYSVAYAGDGISRVLKAVEFDVQTRGQFRP
jgi:hypothetical protein